MVKWDKLTSRDLVSHSAASRPKKLHMLAKKLVRSTCSNCNVCVLVQFYPCYWKQRSCLYQANVLANRWVIVSWCSGLLRSPNDLLQNIEKILNNIQTTKQKWTNNSFRNTKNRPVDCKDNHIEIVVQSSVQDYRLTVSSISTVQSMGIRAFHSCKMPMIWPFLYF